MGPSDVRRHGNGLRLGALAVSTLLLVGGLPPGTLVAAEPLRGGGVEPASPPPRAEGVALASGALREAVTQLKQGKPAGPRVQVRGDLVLVEVLHQHSEAAIERLISRLGGSIEGEVPGELVEALVPFDRLVDLEADPGVDFVRPPLIANEPAGEQSAAQPRADTRVAPASLIVGAEVTKTNAAAWHAAGYTGSGVKVGIVDYFSSTEWNAAVAAGELPTPAGTFCRAQGSSCNLWTAGSKHGEAVAEVIHEMAPGAQLYIATAVTAADLQAAVDYFAGQGVDVISRSLTAEYDGPGDGTGPIATVINNAVAAGMTWFNSAGNSASDGSFFGQYWRAPWTDANSNGWIDFASGDEAMGFVCGFVNGLRWNDWGSNRTDYDLYVFDDPGLTVLKASSEDDQAAGAPPLEHVSPTCGTSDVDYVLIRRYAAGGGSAGDTLELMVNQSALEYWQNPYSATGPASDTASAGAIVVGAIDPATGITIGSYSSQGPTNDSRIKPDLSAAACVGSFTYDPDCFNGTSAATPAAAGAAALVLEAGAATTPGEVKSYLLTQATVDRGATGSDNVYGAGELILPTPAATPTPTPTPTGTPTPTPTGTPTPTPTPTPGLAPTISAGYSHTCAIETNGTVTCWGDAWAGATTVPAGTYKAVSAGQSFTCAIKSDDTLACWGTNTRGQATPPPGTFTDVSAGGNHACAIRTDGTLACWGYDVYDQASPPPGTFTDVSAGLRHSCGVRSDTTIACWGENADGQASPPGGSFTSVSAGGWHSCAVSSSNAVCWGFDDDGRTSPPYASYSSVGAGFWHSCGLTTSGAVACWGWDGDGQASPPSGTFASLGVGAWHNCALSAGGTPTCWGWNYYNQTVTEWPAATTYVPVEPTRLLDSRTGNGLSGTFKANIARSFQVAGRGPVPANAVAVTGNFTVTGQTAAGYGSLTPVATSTPPTSTINFPVGVSAANNVTVALGPDGKLGAVYKAKTGATTHFVFDVTGYFLEDETGATYEPVEPVRLLDTRAANGLDGVFVSRAPRTWQISGRGGIPAEATAITANLTIVGETGSGYVAVGPIATATPTTSTLNVAVGDTRANGLTVKLAGDGTVSAVYMAGTGKTTHLVLDVTGYYVGDLSGARFHPLTPDRVLDSRYEIGLDGALMANTAETLVVAARVGVPDDATAVTGNLTVVGQTKPGYASMTRVTTDSPTTSTLNFPVGQTRANGVTGPLSGSGTVGLVYKAASGATTNLVLDVTGYFALEPGAGTTSLVPPATPSTEDRWTDSRLPVR